MQFNDSDPSWARRDLRKAWEALALRPLVYRADYLTIEDLVDSDADRRTRLERMLAGDEPDVYAAHRQSLSAGYAVPPRETEEGRVRGGPYVEDCGGLFDEPNHEIASHLLYIPDLGRRSYGWAGRCCLENDRVRDPEVVDDPSGDDVAADAPRCSVIGGCQ